MRRSKDRRPRGRREQSVSRRTEDSQSWAKSVEHRAESVVPEYVEALLVSEETASAMLGISPRFVWRLAQEGILRTRRIGRRKLYVVSSLKAYAEDGLEVH